jgi:hypothetical protein
MTFRIFGSSIPSFAMNFSWTSVFLAVCFPPNIHTRSTSTICRNFRDVPFPYVSAHLLHRRRGPIYPNTKQICQHGFNAEAFYTGISTFPILLCAPFPSPKRTEEDQYAVAAHPNTKQTCQHGFNAEVFHTGMKKSNLQGRVTTGYLSSALTLKYPH